MVAISLLLSLFIIFSNKGICCADHYHCCPNGSVCDLENKQCIVEQGDAKRSTGNLISDAYIMHKSTEQSSSVMYSQPLSRKTVGDDDDDTNAKKATWCGACGDSWACCANHATNSWYCCPYMGVSLANCAFLLSFIMM
ncbi:unnamed protein product [Trichobilharzia regenti]|nr:unnamed protein product [Trichobilharzia regenti]